MKTLFIFDFDDTLALTNSHVIVNDSLRLSSRDFAKYRVKPADKLNFSEFMDIKGGKLIQSTVDAMQLAIDQHGYENVYIVTARSVAPPVKRFLSKMNIETPKIIATGGSEGKARWLIQRLMLDNYQSVVVYEDCKKNIEMLNQVVDTYNGETGNNVDYSSVCVLVLDENIMRFTKKQLRETIRQCITMEYSVKRRK
jgi:phosphoglycolate phosphatase-like HAD superfamily hydrolase